MQPNVSQAIAPASPAPPAPPARRPYAPPTLTDFGPVAGLTHGATGAGVDAGIYS